METIDILPIVNRLNHLLFVNVAGQGQLDNKTVNVSIPVELIDALQEFLFGHTVFKTDES